MKEAILEALRQNKGQYVSGQSLSRALGCSRMAVWKHIEELRERGYRIESVHRKGYRLLAEPDSLDPESWKRDLTTKWLGRKAFFYPSLETTQAMAHQLAKEGEPQGTIVVADRQTGGRGRLGRNWHSPAGVGIWTSFILRPRIPLHSAPQITLVSAAAVARSLAHFGYRPQIKWPNDVLLDEKKVCGILTELQGDPDRIAYMIVGIGINVHQREEDFPEDLREKATSLHLAGHGNVPRRQELLRKICQEFEALYELYLEHGFYPIKAIWESYSISLDRPLRVTTLAGSFAGVARGITDQGVLMVEDEHGRIHHIHSADIEIGSQT